MPFNYDTVDDQCSWFPPTPKGEIMANKGVEAVIWDLGGVILRTMDLSYRERWEARFGLEAWELSKLIFGSEASRRASVGEATEEDIWDSLQDQLKLTDQERREIEADFFAGDEVDEKLVSFIRTIHKVNKSGMITNAWPDIRHWIQEEWKIADAFDHIVISAEVGIVKPDPRIYLLSLDALDVLPSKALFIDDFIENVEGAQAVGMHAIHFRDPEQVMEDLRKQLLLRT
jgi:epoxide hydrolase-like predicted phosphatase